MLSATESIEHFGSNLNLLEWVIEALLWAKAAVYTNQSQVAQSQEQEAESDKVTEVVMGC